MMEITITISVRDANLGNRKRRVRFQSTNRNRKIVIRFFTLLMNNDLEKNIASDADRS